MVEKELIMFDMNKFNTREEWLEYAIGKLPNNYIDLGKIVLKEQIKTQHAHLLYFAFISRGRGLHEGVVDQIKRNNPHCVFPLNRAFVELMAYLIYCNSNPHYIDVMLQLGPEKNRAKKV